MNEGLLNRWKLASIWESYSQGIGIEDLHEELLYSLQQDQKEEFWLVVEDQNEPILIGWINFEYGMHLEGIVIEYRERLLMWVVDYVEKHPQSRIGVFYKSGLWDADILKIASNITGVQVAFFIPQALKILRSEVLCPARVSKNKKPIVPHSSFSVIYVKKYVITELEFENINAQSSHHVASSDLYLEPLTDKSPFAVMKLCNRLSKTNGFEPFYKIQNDSISTISSSNGYRIPTTIEWEHIARCNTKFDYSGGQIVDQVAWYEGNSKGRKHIVGQRKANKWGVFDMTGNVDELVHNNVLRNRIQKIKNLDDLKFRQTEHFCVFGGTYMSNVMQASLHESCHKRRRNTVGQRYFGVRLIRYACE
jgi:hypothetical protein